MATASARIRMSVLAEQDACALTFWPAPPDHWNSTELPGLAGTTSSASCAFRPQLRSGLDAPLTGLMSEIRRIGLGPG